MRISATSLRWRRSRRRRSSWISRRCSAAFWNWRERRPLWSPRGDRSGIWDWGAVAWGVGSLGEQLGFDEWDAVEAPGGVGHFVDQLSFDGVGGLVVIEKLLDVALVGFGILGGQESGAGCEAVAESVLR